MMNIAKDIKAIQELEDLKREVRARNQSLGDRRYGLAKAAMQAILANCSLINSLDEKSLEFVASKSVLVADMQMKQLEKSK